MDELKQQFYEVMHKYQKPFSEEGVTANLTQWNEPKQGLLQLLRRHPLWNAAVCLSAKAAVKRCMDMGDILITTSTVRNAAIAALSAKRSLSVCRVSELPVPASGVEFALPAMSK